MNELSMKRVWLSVILQAIADYYNCAESAVRVRNEANFWLFGGGKEASGFVCLCDTFGIDYSSVCKTIRSCCSMRQYKERMSCVESAEKRRDRLFSNELVFSVGSNLSDILVYAGPK